ncbi:MAG: aspartate aminotransferase family protein, partial [Promethearchaeota archaeon]
DKETKEPDMEKCNQIQYQCVFNGLLIATSMMRTRNNALLIFSPPLITTKEDIDNALEIFQDVLSKLS